VFAKLHKATISVVMSVNMSVCPHDRTLLPLGGGIFVKFYESVLLQSVQKSEVSLKSNITCILYAHLRTFLTTLLATTAKIAIDITRLGQ